MGVLVGQIQYNHFGSCILYIIVIINIQKTEEIRRQRLSTVSVS